MLFTERVYNELRFRLMDMLFCDKILDFEKEYLRKALDVVDRLHVLEVSQK
jgi:hypothetical protein